ncbi:MAG: prepilin-type N-terminal cleavage/methylation domain-containing protein [Smithellaceae bacterium]
MKEISGIIKSNLTRSARRRKGGFTLLELLIAMSLLIVVIGLAGLAMRLSFRTVASGEMKVNSLERMRSSMYIVSAQIQSQIPAVDQTDINRKVIFQGDRKSLQFVSGYSIWSGRQGYVHVHYSLRDDEQGKLALLASENIHGKSDKTETTLFDGFDELSFEYFSTKRDVRGVGEWTDEWNDVKWVPQIVRMRLTYGEETYVFILPVRAQKTE